LNLVLATTPDAPIRYPARWINTNSFETAPLSLYALLILMALSRRAPFSYITFAEMVSVPVFLSFPSPCGCDALSDTPSICVHSLGVLGLTFTSSTIPLLFTSRLDSGLHCSNPLSFAVMEVSRGEVVPPFPASLMEFPPLVPLIRLTSRLLFSIFIPKIQEWKNFAVRMR